MGSRASRMISAPRASSPLGGSGGGQAAPAREPREPRDPREGMLADRSAIIYFEPLTDSSLPISTKPVLGRAG